MGNLIKRTTSVGEFGITEPTELITAVSQFMQSTNSRTAQNSIPLTTGSFENKSTDSNFKYLSRNDDNPLVYGLKNLDRMSMVIGGKSSKGVLQFQETGKYMKSTPSHMMRAGREESIDIILTNLEMLDSVREGVPAGRLYAIEFYMLCNKMSQDIKRGVRILNTYGDAVYMTGYNTIMEWANSG